MATPTLAPDSPGKRPLAVSLERTLLRNSLWLDLFFTACGRNGADGPKALLWLLGGAGDGRHSRTFRILFPGYSPASF